MPVRACTGRTHPDGTAGGEHSEVWIEIAVALRLFVKQRKLGRVYGADTGFVFSRDPDTVLAPDTAFVRQDRLPPREDRRGFMPVIPDLVVEVIWPSDRLAAVTERALYYVESGVNLVWVVNPRDRTVPVYATGRAPRLFTVEDELNGGEVLPDFRMPVDAIFA